MIPHVDLSLAVLLAANLAMFVASAVLVSPFVAERVSQAQLRSAILLISAGSAVLLLLR